MKDRAGISVLNWSLGSAWMTLLLAASWFHPQSDLVCSLRGGEALASELDTTRSVGYYEALLDAGQATGPGASQASLDDEDATPPPAVYTQFHESGLAVISSSYVNIALRPSADLVWNEVRYRTNRLGHRSPEIAVPKPKGVYRILVLGSSNTFGHGVPDEAVYPRLLERWLNERSDPNRRFEVVNLAVPGQSPTQRLARLASGELDSLEPDWILTDATAIDVWIEQKRLHGLVTEGILPPFEFVRQAIRSADLRVGDSLATAGRKLDRVYKVLLDGTYSAWAAEGRRLGVPSTVVILPRADSSLKSPGLLALMRETAMRHGIDVIDLSDAFDGMSVREFRIGSWDKHPSVQGHHALFEALRDVITARKGVPEPGLRSGNEN